MRGKTCGISNTFYHLLQTHGVLLSYALLRKHKNVYEEERQIVRRSLIKSDADRQFIELPSCGSHC